MVERITENLSVNRGIPIPLDFHSPRPHIVPMPAISPKIKAVMEKHVPPNNGTGRGVVHGGRPNANLARGKKYVRMMDATSDMRHDYLVEGMTRGELYHKYRKLVERSFKLTTLGQWLADCGLPAIKRDLDRERAKIAGEMKKYERKSLVNAKRVTRNKARREVEKNHGEELALKVKDEALARERKAQELHTIRMAKEADKAFGVIESINPNPKSVGGFVGLLSDYDKLARKIYRMDDSAPVSAHQFNLSILVGGGQLEAAPLPNVHEVEAEVMEG